MERELDRPRHVHTTNPRETRVPSFVAAGNLVAARMGPLIPCPDSQVLEPECLCPCVRRIDAHPMAPVVGRWRLIEVRLRHLHEPERIWLPDRVGVDGLIAWWTRLSHLSLRSHTHAEDVKCASLHG
jgi:hypothetical protein